MRKPILLTLTLFLSLSLSAGTEYVSDSWNEKETIYLNENGRFVLIHETYRDNEDYDFLRLRTSQTFERGNWRFVNGTLVLGFDDRSTIHLRPTIENNATLSFHSTEENYPITSINYDEDFTKESARKHPPLQVAR